MALHHSSALLDCLQSGKLRLVNEDERGHCVREALDDSGNNKEEIPQDQFDGHQDISPEKVKISSAGETYAERVSGDSVVSAEQLLEGVHESEGERNDENHSNQSERSRVPEIEEVKLVQHIRRLKRSGYDEINDCGQNGWRPVALEGCKRLVFVILVTHGLCLIRFCRLYKQGL